MSCSLTTRWQHSFYPNILSRQYQSTILGGCGYLRLGFFRLPLVCEYPIEIRKIATDFIKSKIQLSLTHVILASLRRKSKPEVGLVSETPSDRSLKRVLSVSQQNPRCTTILTRIICKRGPLGEWTLQKLGPELAIGWDERTCSSLLPITMLWHIRMLPACLVFLNPFGASSVVNLAKVVCDRLLVYFGKKFKSSSLVNQDRYAERILKN